MITALSLNPCLDKTMTLDCFDPDAPNRVEIARMDLGGKGVNVARVLSIFPGEHQLMGFDFEGSPGEKELAAGGAADQSEDPGGIRPHH